MLHRISGHIEDSNRSLLLTNCRDGSYDFTKFQFVQNCSFSGCVQPDHKNSHFFFAEEAFEKGSEDVTHPVTQKSQSGPVEKENISG